MTAHPRTRRLFVGAVVALALWWVLPNVVSATGHCSGDFVLNQHACEVAHHGPLVAVVGAVTGLVALVGTGLIEGASGAGRRPLPGQRREGDTPAVGPNTLNTQDSRLAPDGAEADVEPGADLRDPMLADDGDRVGDAARTGLQVEPLDPGLPDLDPLPETAIAQVPTDAPPLRSQEVIDRWTILGADGAGRILDHTGQQILTIHTDGVIMDLAGNPIQSIEGDGAIVAFVDGQGRQIEYNAAGDPVQRVPTELGGTVFRPVSDLPAAIELRPDLNAAVATAWTGAGAGPDGQLYGADGSVIGRIDTDGVMHTLDGVEITGFTSEAGRITEFGTPDGTRVRTPGAPEVPIPAADAGVRTPRGDDELADLVRQTEASQARQDADTRVGERGAPAADPDTRAGDPAADVESPRTGGDPETRVTPPASGEAEAVPSDTRIRQPELETAPTTEASQAAVQGDETVRPPAEAPPAGVLAEGDSPRASAAAGDPPRPADAPDGPRGAGALSTAMDLQGAIDQVQREVAAGRSTEEALTRATAMTWAGNAVGDGVNTNIGWGNGWDAGRVTDVRVTLLGSTMLPEGMNNLLPDQMAANTIGTGMDAIVALTESAASSLGGGALDTSHLDEFTQRLADRPGADPWAGYARLGELLGEEVGNADGNALQAVSNLGSEAWTLREDIAVEVGASVSEFGESAAQGRHGSVLQGYAELAQAAGDPPDPAQFGRDLGTLVRVAWDDASGGGETGGFGQDFWQAQADHANQTIRGVPVVGTVFDGYAQIGAGIEDQGVGGFADEMGEGATALAGEAYDYLRSWF